MKSIIFVTYLIIFLKFASSATEYDGVFKEIAKVEFRNAITEKAITVWNWAKEQAKSQDTFVGKYCFRISIIFSNILHFVGRCFGIGKKLQFVIPLVIFSLGIIITTLKFLTLFTLKGVGIGIVLLIMNLVGWSAKVASWKSQLEHHGPTHHPQNVHFHLHKDKDQYTVEHSGPDGGWNERVSEGLSKTTSLAEKVELLNLYKRLGFNVDQSVLSQYR